MPGATVVITNQETGVAPETVCGDAELYRVSGLSPGRYRVSASLTGVKEAVAENIAVAAEEIRGLDFKLETGDVKETDWFDNP